MAQPRGHCGVSIAGSGRRAGYGWLLVLVQCVDTELLCGLNPEETDRDEQCSRLPFSSPILWQVCLIQGCTQSALSWLGILLLL